MNDNEKKSLFLKCSCAGHCFELQRYSYENEHPADQGFNLTVWTYGRVSEKLCWRERIRWAWNIIKTGCPWADGVMIDNNQAKEMVEYINQHLPKE